MHPRRKKKHLPEHKSQALPSPADAVYDVRLLPLTGGFLLLLSLVLSLSLGEEFL